jgi:hypothetical protein
VAYGPNTVLLQIGERRRECAVGPGGKLRSDPEDGVDQLALGYRITLATLSEVIR